MMSATSRARLNSVIVRGASPNEADSPARGREWWSWSRSRSRRCRSRSSSIHGCQVQLGRRSESRGYGFVTMETTEEAERCIKYLHNTVFDGRLISVKKAQRSRRGNPRWQDRDYHSRDQRQRSRSPYNKRKRTRVDDYSDSCKRRRVG